MVALAFPVLAQRSASRSRLAAQLLLALALMLGAAGHVQAMTVTYQCLGHRVLTAEFTPRRAQVHFEGQHWTLTRTRTRTPTYVDKAQGITVVAKERQLTLQREGEALECQLQSQALTPENLGIAPPSASAAASAMPAPRPAL